MNTEAIASDPFFIKAALWAQIVGFISGIYLAYYLFERKKGWMLGFERRSALSHFGQGLAWGAGLITVSCACIWIFGGIHVVDIQWSMTTAYDLAIGLLLFVGVALNEELFARGYLQGIVKQRYGVKIAVAGPTVVFALLHSNNPGMWDSPFPFINILWQVCF